MVVLKRVQKEWRLFCVLECIGMSLVLALLAVKVTNNSPSVARDNKDHCVTWKEECTVYDWDFIVHTFVIATTVCALLLSKIDWSLVVKVTLSVIWLGLDFIIHIIFKKNAFHAGWVYGLFAVVLTLCLWCKARQPRRLDHVSSRAGVGGDIELPGIETPGDVLIDHGGEQPAGVGDRPGFFAKLNIFKQLEWRLRILSAGLLGLIMSMLVAIMIHKRRGVEVFQAVRAFVNLAIGGWLVWRLVCALDEVGTSTSDFCKNILKKMDDVWTWIGRPRGWYTRVQDDNANDAAHGEFRICG